MPRRRAGDTFQPAAVDTAAAVLSAAYYLVHPQLAVLLLSHLRCRYLDIEGAPDLPPRD